MVQVYNEIRPTGVLWGARGQEIAFLCILWFSRESLWIVLPACKSFFVFLLAFLAAPILALDIRELLPPCAHALSRSVTPRLTSSSMNFCTRGSNDTWLTNQKSSLCARYFVTICNAIHSHQNISLTADGFRNCCFSILRQIYIQPKGSAAVMIQCPQFRFLYWYKRWTSRLTLKAELPFRSWRAELMLALLPSVGRNWDTSMEAMLWAYEVNKCCWMEPEKDLILRLASMGLGLTMRSPNRLMITLCAVRLYRRKNFGDWTTRSWSAHSKPLTSTKSVHGIIPISKRCLALAPKRRFRGQLQPLFAAHSEVYIHIINIIYIISLHACCLAGKHFKILNAFRRFVGLPVISIWWVLRKAILDGRCDNRWCRLQKAQGPTIDDMPTIRDQSLHGRKLC